MKIIRKTVLAVAFAFSSQLFAGTVIDIDNAQLELEMKKGTTLVDIRLEEEWLETGVVPNSKTITLFTNNGINPEFVTQFTKISSKDKPVILICRTGNRTSAAAKMITEQLGYSKVLNVKDGIKSWIESGKVVSKYQK